MAAFQVRVVEGQLTLAERLRYRRSALELTAGAVCETLGIAPHYLAALENGRYEALPGEVYVRNFLRRYSRLLVLPADELLSQFDHEITALGLRRHWHAITMTSRVTGGPWRVRGLFLGTIVALVGSYLIWQMVHYLVPPPLTVELPQGIVRDERSAQITGRTDPEVIVFINDVNVTKAPDGTFAEAIELVPGIATVTVRAERRFGWPRIISRQFIVE